MGFVVDSIRKFSIKTSGTDQVCTLQTALKFSAVANNVQIIAAITGQRIRVMGWNGQSDTAAVGRINFRSGTPAGTLLSRVHYLPPNTAVAFFERPVIDSGYFETTVSQGLYMDVVTADVNVEVYYLAYIP